MKSQSGGLILGLIIGLLVGLGLALAVALYVTKAPVPFVNKVPQRTSEQDAAEVERNKTWDPNAPLVGKPVARPGAPAASVPGAGTAVTAGTPPAVKPAARDPAAILAGINPAPPASAPKSKPGKPLADPFIYFVQAGAFQRSDDAEQQRAKLAMIGVESRLVEREQSGRTVFRVRIGPYDKQAQADDMKERLSGSGIESVLVRIDRPTQ